LSQKILPFGAIIGLVQIAQAPSVELSGAARVDGENVVLSLTLPSVTRHFETS
jgi:hypothetical protein